MQNVNHERKPIPACRASARLCRSPPCASSPVNQQRHRYSPIDHTIRRDERPRFFQRKIAINARLDHQRSRLPARRQRRTTSRILNGRSKRQEELTAGAELQPAGLLDLGLFHVTRLCNHESASQHVRPRILNEHKETMELVQVARITKRLAASSFERYQPDRCWPMIPKKMKPIERTAAPERRNSTSYSRSALAASRTRKWRLFLIFFAQNDGSHPHQVSVRSQTTLRIAGSLRSRE